MLSPGSSALEWTSTVLVGTPAHVLPLYSLCIFNRTTDVYSLMERSLVSTPLEFRAAHWFIFMLAAAVPPSERQCHLVDGGSVLPGCHFCVSYHIPVVSPCLSIGQTSPVKSLKPVSKNISFPISSLLFPHRDLSLNLISKLFVLQLNQ